MSKGPLELVGEIAAMLDELGTRTRWVVRWPVPWVGEPRATADVDVAIEAGPERGTR